MSQQGRKPTAVGDPKIEELTKALRLGHFMQDACAHAGLTPQAVNKWYRRAEVEIERVEAGGIPDPKEQHFVSLVSVIKEAQVAAWSRNLQIVQEAADAGTWQAAAWFLERNNKKWSNRTEVTGANGGPIATVSVDDVDTKLRNLIAASEADRGVATTT